MVAKSALRNIHPRYSAFKETELIQPTCSSVATIGSTDVPDSVKQFDIKTTVVAEVLVAPSHPLIAAFVQRALETWKFKAAKQDGKPVAYLGILQIQNVQHPLWRRRQFDVFD